MKRIILIIILFCFTISLFSFTPISCKLLEEYNINLLSSDFFLIQNILYLNSNNIDGIDLKTNRTISFKDNSLKIKFAIGSDLLLLKKIDNSKSISFLYNTNNYVLSETQLLNELFKNEVFTGNTLNYYYNDKFVSIVYSYKQINNQYAILFDNKTKEQKMIGNSLLSRPRFSDDR